MDAIGGPILGPAAEVAVDRAARSQILWDRPPLAPGTQNTHQPVDDLAHVYGALIAAGLGWRDQGLDQSPLLHRQVAGIAQLAAVIPVSTAVAFQASVAE